MIEVSERAREVHHYVAKAVAKHNERMSTEEGRRELEAEMDFIGMRCAKHSYELERRQKEAVWKLRNRRYIG